MVARGAATLWPAGLTTSITDQRQRVRVDAPVRRRSTGRRQAYAWLSKQLSIPVEITHIGEFDEDMCKRAIEACDRHLRPEYLIDR